MKPLSTENPNNENQQMGVSLHVGRFFENVMLPHWRHCGKSCAYPDGMPAPTHPPGCSQISDTAPDNGPSLSLPWSMIDEAMLDDGS